MAVTVKALKDASQTLLGVFLMLSTAVDCFLVYMRKLYNRGFHVGAYSILF